MPIQQALDYNNLPREPGGRRAPDRATSDRRGMPRIGFTPNAPADIDHIWCDQVLVLTVLNDGTPCKISFRYSINGDQVSVSCDKLTPAFLIKHDASPAHVEEPWYIQLPQRQLGRQFASAKEAYVWAVKRIWRQA